MKKFRFPLNTVLSYKEQVLDNLQNEQAVILKNIADAQRRLDKLESEFLSCSKELDERKKTGITINHIRTYEKYLINLNAKIVREQEYLANLEEKKEKKRQEVVAARTDTKSLEKLKEKKMQIYQQEIQKSEELFIEEFVSNVRATSR